MSDPASFYEEVTGDFAFTRPGYTGNGANVRKTFFAGTKIICAGMGTEKVDYYKRRIPKNESQKILLR